MLTDLQTKLDRYETRAADCAKAARKTKGEHGRAFYEELAYYYTSLAADFRRVLAKRAGASVAAE
jgi:hypothetical protein